MGEKIYKMKLKLKNFRCYSDKEIDFGKEGLTLLSGGSGTGKSTLMMAIEFALFGTGTKIISHGKKTCYVELEMTIHGSDMKIVRKKGPNHLIVNDVYEDQAGEKVIQDKFGKIFNSVSYIPQNIKKSFVLMSPSERLEFLEHFSFENVNITEIKDRAKNVIREASDSHIKTIGNLEFATKVLSDFPIPEKVLFPIKCTDKEKAEKCYEIKLKNSITTLKKTEKEIKQLETDLNDTNIRLAVFNEKTKNLHAIKNKITETRFNMHKIIYKGDEHLKDLQKKLHVILSSKEMADVTKQQKRLEELKQKEMNDMMEMENKLSSSLWQDIEKKDIDGTIQHWSERVDKIKRYTLLKTSLLKIKVVDDPREKLKEIREKIITVSEQLKLQKQVMSCPHCFKKMKMVDGVMIKYNDSTLDTSPLDTSPSDELLKTLKTEESMLSENEKHYTKRVLIETEMKELCIDEEDNNAEEEYEMARRYKSENISNEQQLQSISKKIKTNMYSSTLATMEKKIKEKLDAIPNIQYNSQSEETEEELREMITKENEYKTKTEMINKQLEQYKSEEKKLEEDIHNAHTSSEKIGEIVGMIEEKKACIDENISKRDSSIYILKNIEKYNEYKKQMTTYENLTRQKKELEKREIVDRKRYALACSFRDKILQAESIAIENMIENINTHVQLYLDHFFPDNPMNARICAFKETKKETKPSINIDIDYKGIEHDLTMLSGGELSRVILAFTLALAEIHNSPLILLDECTSSLDQELTSSVLSGLKENFNDKLVVLIAHQVVQGVFDTIIKL